MWTFQCDFEGEVDRKRFIILLRKMDNYGMITPNRYRNMGIMSMEIFESTM